MRGNGLKVLALFLVLLFTLFFFSCEKKEGETPLDEKLGISFHGSPPSSYNCNWDSRFEVNLNPWNDASLTEGYLRIWFELWQADESKYRSNYMDLALGADSNYTLEFGGEIEGYYKIIGGLAYYPGEGEPSSAVVSTKDDHSITATQKSSFAKTMHLEYDCQYSYGFGSTTFERLTSAFHVADTDTDFFRDEDEIPPEKIEWDSLGVYHVRHWSATWGYNMHLLAIEGLLNNIKQIMGATIKGPFGFSFVFVQDIFDFAPDGAETDAIKKTAVHELGHQRANLTHASSPDPSDTTVHPELHDSPFCVMNQGFNYTENNDNDPDNDPPNIVRWFIHNPHFCDMCVNAIKSIDW